MAVKKTAENQTAQTALPEFLEETEAGKELILRKQEEEKLSRQLDKTTEFIRKEVASVAKGFCRIGYKLWEARENKLYEGQGFKNVYQYAESVLGFKKATTANYIGICEKFSVHKDGKPTLQLVSAFSTFSHGQLSEMLTIPEEKLNDVTPDMKCKDIRKMKNTETVEDGDEESGENEGTHVKKANPAISIFERILTRDNLSIVHKLLQENIGREISIFVEDNGVYDLSDSREEDEDE
jgi:hypothetical protein